MQECDLEWRDELEIDPALKPPRPENKAAWLHEQFTNYVGRDEVRQQFKKQMDGMEISNYYPICGPENKS